MTAPLPDTLQLDEPRAAVERIPLTRGMTFRQAAVTLLIALVLGIIAAAIELYADWQAMRGEIRAQTERILNLVHGPSAQAAFQFNDELAIQVVDGLFDRPETRQVILRDNFGRTIARRERTDAVQSGQLAERLFGDLTHYVLDLVHDTAAGQRIEVGSLELHLSATEIAASFYQRGRLLVIVGLVKALAISALVVLIFYFIVTRPLLALHSAITRIDPAHPGRWPRPALRFHRQDELGQIVNGLDELMRAFQRGLDQRDQARDENLRLGAELDVSRRIQQMVLPSQAELQAVPTLDIAAHMEPAGEVGGDYYDILPHAGGLRIGIGDVTGHGLESGVVMLMTQSAVRTMLTAQEGDIVRIMEALNGTIYHNVQRMGCGKNLTLALLDHQAVDQGAVRGRLRIAGQHESVIVVRADGSVELVDTDELGFPIGLVEEVAEFVGQVIIDLHRDDVVVLYTDGITEAADESQRLYGLERLIEVTVTHRSEDAEAIKDTIIDDVKRHIATQTLYDDLTLVVLKQR
jgi:sigma-B regulation protein RsbU (phosphoserine phosphatase)